MQKKHRNELEILTQIETYRRAIEQSRASVLRYDETPSLGQLRQAHDDQMKWEAMIETLNWALTQPEPIRLKEGDNVQLTLFGTIRDVSDAHGLCYEVTIPKMGGFAVRTVWVNPNEVEELK